MDSSIPILSLTVGAVAATAAVAPRLKARIELSRAKHRSLAGHSKMSRRVARLIPAYEFGIDDFFRADGAQDFDELQEELLVATGIDLDHLGLDLLAIVGSDRLQCLAGGGAIAAI